jgi:predicted porin
LTCIKSNLAKVAKCHLLDLGQIKLSFVVFGDLRMKKLLIASAALAMVAGTAQAQSTVTVYGSIDTGYSSVESNVKTIATGASVKTTQAGIQQSSDVTSRWGMRGSEDLGGGLKANFVVETGIGTGTNAGSNATSPATNFDPKAAQNSNTSATGGWVNTTVLGNRAMWAGISTAGGLEVRGGWQNQFIRDIATTYNSNGTTNVVGDLLAGNSSVFADRHNAISVTQTMGALKFGVAMTGKTTEETGKADVDAGKGYELMANYAAGKFALGGAYRKVDSSALAVTQADKAKAADTLVGTTAGTFQANEFTAAPATNRETETTVIGTSYDFGIVKAFAAYGTQDVKESIANTKTEREVTTVGVNGNVNANTRLFATYSTGETKESLTAAARDIDGFVFGARYSLSKRTTAYAVYGEADIDTGAAATATTNTKVKQYAIGLNHAF